MIGISAGYFISFLPFYEPNSYEAKNKVLTGLPVHHYKLEKSQVNLS